MNTDVYRKYIFDFDAEVYLREFKKALESSGVTKPSQFNQLLKNAGIKDYDIETVKSYFYGRRVPPLNVFIAVCKSLHLSADKIAFPQSVQSSTYIGDLSDAHDLIWSVFYTYEEDEDGKIITGLTEHFDEENYKTNVDKLALILSRYNYLIQKYHYADVANEEIRQIGQFTERYIIERGRNEKCEWASVRDWIKGCKDEDFLDAFYNKYTLAFYCKSCHSLLEIISAEIPDEFTSYARQLLPYQDMNEVKA